MEPFFEEFRRWREHLPDYLQPFAEGALFRDDGSVLTTIANFPSTSLPGFVTDIQAGSWQHNFEIFRDQEDIIENLYGQILTQVSLAQNVRAVEKAGDEIKNSIRLILLSTTFDPVGSSLATMMAHFAQKTNAEKTALPLHTHLLSLAPDLFTGSTKNRPHNYLLNREHMSWAKIRTARHFRELHEAFLQQEFHQMAVLPSLFGALWIFSSTDERGTVLDDYHLLTSYIRNAYSLWFTDHITDTRDSLPTPSGDPCIVNALGVFELQYQKEAMRKALAGKLTLSAIQKDLGRWRHWSQHRQKLNNAIRRFIHQNHFDQTFRRVGKNTAGESLDTPFRFKSEASIETFGGEILSARRNHEKSADVLGKTTRRMEEVLAADRELVLAEIKNRLDTPEDELPSAIAFLCSWLGEDCTYFTGDVQDRSSGMAEIWIELTQFFDKLNETIKERQEMKELNQSIKDKFHMQKSLERRSSTAAAPPMEIANDETLTIELSADSAKNSAADEPGRVDQESVAGEASIPDSEKKDESSAELDMTATTAHDSQEHLILENRQAINQEELEKLHEKKQALAQKLLKVDQALENSGERRALFENKIEKVALDEFDKINARLQATAPLQRGLVNEIAKWEEAVKSGFLRFIVYALIVLLLFGASPLAIGYFSEIWSYSSAKEWTGYLLTLFSSLHTIINGYRFIVKPRKKLQKARENLEQLKRKQKQLSREGESRLAKLERDRTQYAAHSLALEWFHELKASMRRWHRKLSREQPELEKLEKFSLESWEQFQTRDDERVFQFPNKSALGHIWLLKEGNIQVELENFFKRPGRERSQILAIADIEKYVEGLRDEFHQISEKHFGEYFDKDPEEMLMVLAKETNFNVERMLDRNIRNTIALANLKDLYAEQRVTKALLIASNSRGERSDFLQLLKKLAPSAAQIPAIGGERIIFYRVLEGYAFCNWGYSNQARSELSNYPQRETEVACEPDREFKNTQFRHSFFNPQDKKNHQLLLKLWSCGVINHQENQFKLEEDGEYLGLPEAINLLGKAKSHGLLKRLYKSLEEIMTQATSYRPLVDQFVQKHEDDLEGDEMAVITEFADTLNPLG